MSPAHHQWEMKSHFSLWLWLLFPSSTFSCLQGTSSLSSSFVGLSALLVKDRASFIPSEFWIHNEAWFLQNSLPLFPLFSGVVSAFLVENGASFMTFSDAEFIISYWYLHLTPFIKGTTLTVCCLPGISYPLSDTNTSILRWQKWIRNTTWEAREPNTRCNTRKTFARQSKPWIRPSSVRLSHPSSITAQLCWLCTGKTMTSVWHRSNRISYSASITNSISPFPHLPFLLPLHTTPKCRSWLRSTLLWRKMMGTTASWSFSMGVMGN